MKYLNSLTKALGMVILLGTVGVTIYFSILFLLMAVAMIFGTVVSEIVGVGIIIAIIWLIKKSIQNVWNRGR